MDRNLNAGGTGITNVKSGNVVIEEKLIQVYS